jgi:hypothetical protein
VGHIIIEDMKAIIVGPISWGGMLADKVWALISRSSEAWW